MTGRSEHFAEGTEQHYRRTRALPADSFPGIKVHPRGEMPHTVVQHHTMLGPENDKHGWQWQGVGHEVIQPTETIHTGQPYVGQEHVERYAARRSPTACTPINFSERGSSIEDQDNGSPRLLRVNGELWHMDGLHRTAAARQLGRPFKARVYDADRHNARVPTEPHPGADHSSIVSHVSEGHIGDNEFIDSETDWSTSKIHDYHAELHRGGVADHHHA